MVVNPDIQVLNISKGTKNDEDVKSVELAQKVNKQILKLFSSHTSEDGKSVDYKGISNSNEYKEFVESTKSLQHIKLSELDENERKVLFLNLYNALTIHSYVEKGIPKTSTEKLNIIASVGYQIGKLVFSLNDMEHGVLRGNKKPPAFYFVNPLFSETDPRIKYVCKLDPRVHFALVCGSKGCPPVRIYSEKNIERGLNSATELFLGDPNNFEIQEKVVFLSKIFEWYAKDFAIDQLSLLNWISKYLEKDQKEKVLLSNIRHMIGI
eukprot:gene3490-6138_t